jgi:hypothetical protein
MGRFGENESRSGGDNGRDAEFGLLPASGDAPESPECSEALLNANPTLAAHLQQKRRSAPRIRSHFSPPAE